MDIMVKINVRNVLIGIVGFMLLVFMVKHKENVVTPIFIMVIIASTFGFAWYMNNAVNDAKRTRAPSCHPVDTPLPLSAVRIGHQTQPIDSEDTEAEIRELRNRIFDYRPGQWTLRDVTDEFMRPSKIRLGVMGVQSSGKSSLLNSLHFALTGTWQPIYVESSSSREGGETIFRSFMRITDYVTTVDTRGTVDYAADKANDALAEISGRRGVDPRQRRKGETIDCPIFVFKYSSVTGTQPCKKFLRCLIEKLKKRFDSYPIMVITFANSIANKEEILDDICMEGMQKSSVFFIENYTADSHEEDLKKHKALLKILRACILRADDNITFRWCTDLESTKRKECRIM